MPTAIEKNLSRNQPIRATAPADGQRRPGLWRDTSGGISIMYAMVLPALVGFVGLGVETGYWYVEKRDLQTQADAGSLGGVWEKAWGRVDEITPSAKNEAVRNGFPNNPAFTTIAVNNPPTSGSEVGNDMAVEVIVTQDYDPMFAGIFLGSDVTITARAVSTLIASGSACVHALDGSISDAAETNGSVNLDAPDCTIAADSKAEDAISFTGSSNIVFEKAWTSGGIDYGTANVNLLEGAKTHMWPLQDPYKDLLDTAPSGCDSNINIGNSGTTQITAPHSTSPNNYRTVCSDIHVTGGKSINFAPGIYWMKGSSLNFEGGTITCTSCSTTNGQGVTFIFTTPNNGNVNQIGTVKINGNATVVLNAPGSGTYKGVLFFQDRDTPEAANKTANINGGAGTKLNGAIYFPNNEVQWAGNATLDATCTVIIADTVTFTGNSGLSVKDCASQGVDLEVVQKISLVE